MQRIRSQYRFLDVDVQVRGLIVRPFAWFPRWSQTRLHIRAVFQGEPTRDDLTATLAPVPGRAILRVHPWMAGSTERLLCLALDAHVLAQADDEWIRPLWRDYLQTLTLLRSDDRRFALPDAPPRAAVDYYAQCLADLPLVASIRRDGYAFDCDARRIWLIEGLALTRAERAIRPILSVLRDRRHFDEPTGVFDAALRGVRDIGSPSAVPDLLELWGYVLACAPRRMPAITRSIRKTALTLGGSYTVDLFTSLFGEAQPRTVGRYRRSAPMITPALVHILSARRTELAVSAARALGILGERRVLPALRKLRFRLSGSDLTTLDDIIASLSSLDTLPKPARPSSTAFARLPRKTDEMVSPLDLPCPTPRR